MMGERIERTMGALQLPIFWEVRRFRLRRIKTFESARAAKFHLERLTARWAGNLLGYAVDIAPAEQHFARGDSHHFARRKQPLERTGGRGIMAFVVQRHDHAFVRNVEIDI